MEETAERLGLLADLAERIGARLLGDGTIPITRIAAISEADAGTLTFATDTRYIRAALESRAAAVLIDADLLEGDRLLEEPLAKPILLVPSARVALAQLLGSFLPPRPPAMRHPSAVIDPTAEIGEDVVIGPGVIIGPRARIGPRAVLEAGSVVGADAVVGAETRLAPRAVLLDRCITGARVVLQAGAVVGSDGFGYVPLDGRLLKIPQVGIVELGDEVEIGANTCVDRAQTGVTRIGAGTKLDNLIQIGHNVNIGRGSVIAGQTGIAGSASIGDGVQIGGQAAVRGHIRIGHGVRIAGASRVWDAVPDGAIVSGDPAQHHPAELRKKVHLQNISKLFARVAQLERRRSEEG